MKIRTTITRLHPLISTYPQCDVMRANTYYNDTPETDKQCRKRAVIDVNGVKMCRQHAGAVALDILLDTNIELVVQTEVP